MVRIGQYGGRGGSGGAGARGGRAAVFRQGRRVGDRLSGTVVSAADGGHAWVEVDGQRLLARLEVAAAPGDTLEFVITSLHPEIVLRTIQGRAGGQGGGAGDSELAARYRAARDAFWLRLRETETADTQPCAQKDSRDLFRDRLCRFPELTLAFMEAVHALSAVRALPVMRQGALWLAPWRLPRADAVEIFVYGTQAPSAAMTRMLAAFRPAGFSSGAGQVLADVRAGGGLVSFKLYAEHPSVLGHVDMVALTGGFAAEARCIGVERLTFFPGDVPAFLMQGGNAGYTAPRGRI